MVFIMELLPLLMDERVEVWYMDETSINMWDAAVNGRVWMNVRSPFIVNICRERAFSRTIIGAISNRQPGVIYSTAISTNKEDVFEYFKKLAKHKSKTHDRSVIVADNHVSHHNPELKVFLEE